MGLIDHIPAVPEELVALLHPVGHAAGYYFAYCRCGETFIASKRSNLCPYCAIEARAKLPFAPDELDNWADLLDWRARVRNG